MKNFVEDSNYRNIDYIPKQNNCLTFIALAGYIEEGTPRGTWKNRRPVITVKCDCGKELNVLLRNYLSGKSQSCGCTRRKFITSVKSMKRTFTKEENKKYSSYIKRAKDKQFQFEFTKDEFVSIINSPCVYCGITKLNGLDRIDSNMGYTKANVQPCCGECNMAKYTMTHEQYINFIKRVYNHISMKDLQRLQYASPT